MTKDSRWTPEVLRPKSICTFSSPWHVLAVFFSSTFYQMWVFTFKCLSPAACLLHALHLANVPVVGVLTQKRSLLPSFSSKCSYRDNFCVSFFVWPFWDQEDCCAEMTLSQSCIQGIYSRSWSKKWQNLNGIIILKVQMVCDCRLSLCSIINILLLAVYSCMNKSRFFVRFK